MPSYEIDAGMSFSIEANSEKEAFGIAHRVIADLHDTPPEDVNDVDGEITGVEKIK